MAINFQMSLRLRTQIQLLALRATEPGDLHKSCFALCGVPTARSRAQQHTALPLLSGVPEVSSHKQCWAPAHFFRQLSSFSHRAPGQQRPTEPAGPAGPIFLFPFTSRSPQQHQGGKLRSASRDPPASSHCLQDQDPSRRHGQLSELPEGNRLCLTRPRAHERPQGGHPPATGAPGRPAASSPAA